MNSLKRLLPIITPYKWVVGAGFASFFVARFFEISTYFMVAKGVDAINGLIDKDAQSIPYSLMQIAIAIIFCVVMRFFFVVHARRAMRRAGMFVAFDLRQSLYSSVQYQGSQFFAKIGVGDIMTRAIQDISLTERLISSGMIQIVIMIYAPLFGLSAMLAKSTSLTVLILPLLPIVFVYGYWMSEAMARSSRAVQGRLSALSQHTQENLSGIRTVQAQAQELNEIKRFSITNEDYAKAFYEQSRLTSLMSAWTPFFASIAQLVILMYGGHLVLNGEISVGDLVFFFTCIQYLSILPHLYLSCG